MLADVFTTEHGAGPAAPAQPQREGLASTARQVQLAAYKNLQIKKLKIQIQML